MITKESKILVTGVKGQLGYDCVRELKERGFQNVLGIDREDLDITDEAAVDRFITAYQPDVVMHNAAWTAVDKAEQMPDAVYQVNALGPKYIAEACRKVNATMFYISTDYVFDGKGTRFFETIDAKNGLSVYGRTKSQGEDFVTSQLAHYFILRISWAFGVNGHNFIRTMLNLADSGKKELTVVDDQIGSPTYTFDLSKLMCDMMMTDKYGIYHATNEGVCSWAEFAAFIFKTAGLKVTVHPVSTAEYKKLVPNQADRPLNSRMSKESLTSGGFHHLPTWQDATERYIHDELKR
jgi:dTDP-4-dehydrorhamnose reductase